MVSNILKSEKVKFLIKMAIAFLLLPLYRFCLTAAGIVFLMHTLYTPSSFIPEFLSGFFDFMVLIAPGPLLAIYLYLKIFGILKQSDKLNTFFTPLF